jgi:hypothetical protein
MAQFGAQPPSPETSKTTDIRLALARYAPTRANFKTNHGYLIDDGSASPPPAFFTHLFRGTARVGKRASGRR